MLKASVYRQLQLYFVLAVAFGLPVIGSTEIFFGWRHPHTATNRGHIFMVAYQLVGLLCLYLVLRLQKRSFRDIGVVLPMRITEVAHSFALLAGVFFFGLLTGFAIFAAYSFTGHPIRAFDDSMIFGNQITLATVLFVLINPFHEELIVRAFLITEMEQIYRSTGLAVFVSVFLQSYYHLYQGLPPALVHVSSFTLFSIYFVRTRRIMPVIMTHLFMDAMALAVFARHLLHH